MEIQHFIGAKKKEDSVNEKRCITVSKFLSKYLRHEPETLGLSFEDGGWVNVVDLLAACHKKSFPITREELDEVVETSNKKRFSFNAEGNKIRANQGHSVEVDLQLKPAQPPSVLYHGTAERFLGAIQKTGLQKMSRNHVHMSIDKSTATLVGKRHGKPVVVSINAEAMFQDGYLFFVSDNGVWLTEHVPIKYLFE